MSNDAMSDESKSSLTKEISIFDAALKLSAPVERAAFLDRACGGDANLRAAVESLLKHHKDDHFMVKPGGTVRLSPVTEKPGDMIGRYKLMEQIGEGGFGVVYVAEQREPVRRMVALKISKLGMDTRQVVARFEAERQALAMMDHPNIAKVLDGGATDSGRPYFVMELVRGIKVTEYCDLKHLTTRQRLDLFMQICRAVQHAHQKGVIHRDLKPSNILVTLHDGPEQAEMSGRDIDSSTKTPARTIGQSGAAGFWRIPTPAVFRLSTRGIAGKALRPISQQTNPRHESHPGTIHPSW